MVVKVNARQLQAAGNFEAMGYPTSGAAGLVGNFSVESGADLPTAFRTTNLDHGSNGLAQWRLDRLDAYENFVIAKHPELVEPNMTDDQIDKVMWPWYGRLDYQCEFVDVELKKSYAALHGRLMKGGDPAVLAADVCWHYEMPSKKYSHIDLRIDYAKAIYKAIPSKSGKSAPIVALHDAADEHVKQQNGATATVGIAALAGAGVVASNAVGFLPWYDWVALAGCGIVAIVGGLGAIAASAKAKSVTQAITGMQASLAADDATAPAPAPSPAPVPAAPVTSRLTDAQGLPLGLPQGGGRPIEGSLIERMQAMAPRHGATMGVQQRQGQTIEGEKS